MMTTKQWMNRKHHMECQPLTATLNLAHTKDTLAQLQAPSCLSHSIAVSLNAKAALTMEGLETSNYTVKICGVIPYES